MLKVSKLGMTFTYTSKAIIGINTFLLALDKSTTCHSISIHALLNVL